MRRQLFAAIAVAAGSVAGFGALPSKPDFAYPKTVSKNAQAQLKAALRNDDGPATVRALIDYGLAQASISPDKKPEVVKEFQSTLRKVKDPATKAMILLAQANATGSDSLTAATIGQYTTALQETPTALWEGVVDADVRFFPTLYDFAAAQIPGNDSITEAAYRFNEGRNLPQAYIALKRADNFDKLKTTYLHFEATDAAPYVLEQMAADATNLDQRRYAYQLCMASAYRDSKEVKKAIDYLTRKSISVSTRSLIGLNKKLKVNVTGQCVNKATITVAMTKPSAQTIRKIDLHFPGSGVFAVDTTFEISFDAYGVYTLTPRIPGISADFKNRHVSFSRVRVSDFMLSQPVYGKSSETMALDVINGALQDDVSFSVIKHQVHGTRGKDRFTPTIWNNEGYAPYDQLTKTANILTDRAIYHPGDSVRFAATLMWVKGMKRGLLSGETVNVELLNANYVVIDTLTLTSDSYGRISGARLLPKEGLTGNFVLRIRNYGSTHFMVSDYKSPTFEVQLNAARHSADSVEVTGTVVGFNGFPIADARVALSVVRLPRWIWYRNFASFSGETVASDSVMTSADGSFTARIAIKPGDNLSVQAIASAPNGESRDASCFVPQKLYFISADVAEFIEADKAPVFTVLDSKGETVNRPVRILLTSATDSISVANGADWKNVPSGKYEIIASTADADTLRLSTCVYRATDAMPPAESALFVPAAKINNTDKVLVGTSWDDSNILYTLWTPDSIIEQKWLHPEKGNFFIAANLPQGVDNATLTLHTLRDYTFHTRSVSVVRPNVARNLKVEISSLRDRMVPGQSENWTIKVADNLGKPLPAAVMLDVYSKALDALVPMNWHFNPPSLNGNHFGFNESTAYPTRGYCDSGVSRPQVFGNVSARFNLWGQHWPYQQVFYFHTTARNMMKSAAPVMGAMLKEEAAEAESVDADGVAVEEKALADYAVERVASADSGAAGAGNEPDAGNYRLPEVPVALWAPVLTTDADGSLSVKFTAPNANTTWQVKAMAYGKSLLNGMASAEIVASKPVMVQPQLPRFLRVGDRIELRSLVQNNTDSTATVGSFIELFNPATDSVISRVDFTDEIAAKASALISTRFVAPQESMVGVRVRATSGSFTDGEQTVIAILPADVTVRTGRPIFMPADSADVKVSVERGGVMTFTANATWECVASLPGLLSDESHSALAAAAKLFSASMARGLMRSHPEISLALKRWEGEDSVLISRLQRNEDLKIALLASTPWVGAAQSQTERRARLMLLFDKKLVNATINDAVKDLSRLVRNGGFAWTANSDEPSEWVTMQVLETIARLKRLGYQPAGTKLDGMANAAVEYLDKAIARDFAKNKNAVYPDYVKVRSQFPDVRQSAPSRRAREATVQYLVGHWRDLSLESMARAAIILYENKYPTTARRVIESLRQHEAWNQMPVSSTLLEAFAEVEPGCADVDLIRNNYISRKQSMEWGDGIRTTALIAAILNSGTPWLVPAANELSVKVNGQPVDPNAENFMGEFRLNLPEGGEVEISKGNFPAWGGVFSRSTDSISSVEAFGSDKLKITRSVSGEMKVGSKITMTLTLDATQDMDYVLVRQPRCAAFEPVEQLPSAIWYGYVRGYREPCATETNWFINRLPKGKTVITESFYVTAAGNFLMAPAEAQSQYAPEMQAHSEGSAIAVSE